jgi:hypothetical protein
MTKKSSSSSVEDKNSSSRAFGDDAFRRRCRPCTACDGQSPPFIMQAFIELYFAHATIRTGTDTFGWKSFGVKWWRADPFQRDVYGHSKSMLLSLQQIHPMDCRHTSRFIMVQ